jgi:hypothetical protein
MTKTQVWVLKRTRKADREFLFLIARKMSGGKNILAGNSPGRLRLSAAYLEFGQPSLRHPFRLLRYLFFGECYPV